MRYRMVIEVDVKNSRESFNMLAVEVKKHIEAVMLRSEVVYLATELVQNEGRTILAEKDE